MLYIPHTFLRSRCLPLNQEIVWTFFRFYCGISIAIGAGWAKIPVPEWFVEQVAELGFTLISPGHWAQLAAYGEFVGGLLVAIGLLTRLAAFQLAFQFFVVAFIWYDQPEAFGMYYQQLIFWSFVVIASRGGGLFSLDELIVRMSAHWKPRTKQVLITALLFSSIGLFAGEPIKGSGNIISEQRVPGEFDKVELGAYCSLQIRCGAMHRVVLEGDDNILKEIRTSRRGKALKIDTKEWLQPTHLKVVVYLPYLKAYSHEGWSHTEIIGVNGSGLHIDLPTGSARVQGEVDQLHVKCKGGKLDASQLMSRTANIDIRGRGRVEVFVTESLKVHREQGVVGYLGEPKLEVSGDPSGIGPLRSLQEKRELSYLEFKVKNASRKKRDYIIVGPQDAPFSYGFPMKAGTTRKEHAPVGTRIYEESILGTRGRLLLEVSESTEGKTIVLSD